MSSIIKKTRFSEHFKITKSQKTLEFVDILVDMDIRLFISPWRIAASDCKMSYKIEKTLKIYFSELLRLIKDKNKSEAIHFLKYLKEPKEIHLGYSDRKFNGNGIGDEKAEQLYTVFSNSKAGKTSLLSDICYSQILIEGIGSDNVSDMIAAICRGIFAEFTTQQCVKHDVQTLDVKLDVFNDKNKKWEIREYSLPIYLKEHIILIPKKFILQDKYYSNLFDEYVIKSRTVPEIMKNGNHSALSGLFTILKDGTKKPILKKFYSVYSKKKKDLFEHIEKHGDKPLIEFKKNKIDKLKDLSNDDIDLTISKFIDKIFESE